MNTTREHRNVRDPLDERVAARQQLGLLVVVLAVAVVVLHQAGRGALAGPRLDAPGTWSDWLAARTATEATFALLRLVALAVTAYLAGATALGLVARVAGNRRGVRWADALAVPAVRRVLQRAFGAGLAAAVALGPVAPPHAARPARPAAGLVAGTGEVALGLAAGFPTSAADAPLVLLDPGPTDAAAPPSTTAPSTAAPPTTSPTDRAVALPTPTAEPPPAIATAPAAPVAPAPEPSPAVEVETWEVGAGDHFWGIAEAVLEQAWGRPASEAETARYWTRLVERNAGRLVVPGNPDIVVVGQVLELEPVVAP